MPVLVLVRISVPDVLIILLIKLVLVVALVGVGQKEPIDELVEEDSFNGYEYVDVVVIITLVVVGGVNIFEVSEGGKTGVLEGMLILLDVIKDG